MNRIRRAERFAHECHRDQRRKYNGRPYIEHPMRVAHTATMLGLSDEAIAAAWLHDVIEDCGVTADSLSRQFGYDVAALVVELTNPSKGSNASRRERKAMDRAHIAKASREARALKVIDRLDNIREMVGCDPDFWKVYAAETKQLCDALDCDDLLIAGLLVELRAAVREGAPHA